MDITQTSPTAVTLTFECAKEAPSKVAMKNVPTQLIDEMIGWIEGTMSTSDVVRIATEKMPMPPADTFQSWLDTVAQMCFVAA